METKSDLTDGAATARSTWLGHLKLRVLVVQMGARRGYELARMLETRGALAALYTDAAWPENSTSVTKRFLNGLSPHLSAAVHRRTVQEIPPHKVRSTLAPDLLGAFARRVGLQSEKRHRLEDKVLGAYARRWGLNGANVVLNTTGNGGTKFLEWAKQQGAKIATDIVITPRVHEIVAEERARWPGWECESFSSQANEIYRRHIEEVVALSDLLLCPSQTVVDGLTSVRGFKPDRVAIVPYGLGHVTTTRCEPQPKRILFAGQAGLRKGLPYLGGAASVLKQRDPSVRINVAGNVTDRMRARPECRDLSFLGHLSQEAMNEEFRCSDVFCLPSLAEGSASVVLEALAHGLPCVVTRSAGAPVSDGIEGIVVPERNAEALAEAIWQVVCDRKLRESMSSAALQLANQHRLEKVGSRLVEYLASLVLRTEKT